jgi:hypothetical protein
VCIASVLEILRTGLNKIDYLGFLYDNCWLFAALEITGTDGSLILMILKIKFPPINWNLRLIPKSNPCPPTRK